MQITLLLTLTLHLLAGVFWAGSTFTLARIAAASADRLFWPQIVAAAGAIVTGGYLWHLLQREGSKQVDVLDVQPAAAAREQIAAAVFEWQLGLHKTMLARFLPPIKISVELSLCIVKHQTFPAPAVVVFRKGRS